MVIRRRKTRQVRIGNVKVGGGAPVSVQSMAKTDTADIPATVRQIKALEKAGCEIIRVAVKDMTSAQALDKIKARINIPLVADIHFHFRLALEAIARGVDGLRLNPGNIYRCQELKKVARAAGKRKIPIRVGVNSGSLRISKNRGQKRKKTAYLMVNSALDYIKMLEDFDFYDIVISLKASDVLTTIDAYRKLARLCNYPVHLGITAAGLPGQGTVKSAIGIGSLLLEGIGDTIRVSLTGDPKEEVEVGRQILQSLGLRYFGPEIIACPTCARAQVDIVKITKQMEQKLQAVNSPSRWLDCAHHKSLETGRLEDKRPVKVAIMGCVVNGPGEARDADVGLAGGRKSGIIFRKGKRIKRVREGRMVEELLKEILNPKH
jgi:(E)-4-hydroxy-3-methylbut-2-enyl-diphosphate synthase